MLGAMAGPWIENGLQRLSGEFITRQLGERQLDRAGVGIVLLNSAVRKRVHDGQALRSEDFFRSDATSRSAADEVAERAILAMIAAIDEKQIPFLANFYASIYFSETVDQPNIPTLFALAEGLTYQGMCVINVIASGVLYSGIARGHGEPKPWPIGDQILARAIFDLRGMFLQIENGAEHANALLDYDEIDPSVMKLSLFGNLLFEMMGLSGISSNDSVLIGTRRSLERIAQSPLFGSDLAKIFTQATIDGGTC